MNRPRNDLPLFYQRKNSRFISNSNFNADVNSNIITHLNPYSNHNFNPKYSHNSYLNHKSSNIFMETRSTTENEAPEKRSENILLEFCAKSTIHGLSYCADRNRHWIERAWWILATLLSTYFCINSTYTMWRTRVESPVVLSFSHIPMSIGEIPFPAITVCTQNKFSGKKFNYTSIYESMFKLDGNNSRNVTENELNIMKVAGFICDEMSSIDVLNFFPDTNYSDSSILAIIHNLAPSFANTVIFCKIFDGPWENCSEFLYPSITEDGLCYKFNSLNMEEMFTDQMSSEFFNQYHEPPTSNWNMEPGMESSKNAKPYPLLYSYPIRAFGTGQQFSFTILLQYLSDDIDYLCGGSTQGAKITFHPPNEISQIRKRYFQVTPGKSAIFSITPSVTLTSLDDNNFKPEERRCWFNTERQLKFFKIYTQRNCEMECLTNFTLKECGCVQFSMPRSKGTEICGPAKINCCNKANKKIHIDRLVDLCNCMPACTSISYDADITQADYDIIRTFSKTRLRDNFNYENSTFSQIVVSFKEELFLPTKRSERNPINNFIANAGGLFGLFMGASLLSVFELIYFFTLRIIVSRRKQHKIQQEELEKQPGTFEFLP